MYFGIFMQFCFSIIKTKKICVLARRKTERCAFEELPYKHGDVIQPPLWHRRGSPAMPFTQSHPVVQPVLGCNPGWMTLQFRLNWCLIQAELQPKTGCIATAPSLVSATYWLSITYESRSDFKISDQEWWRFRILKSQQFSLDIYAKARCINMRSCLSARKATDTKLPKSFVIRRKRIIFAAKARCSGKRAIETTL